jgi:hypothetical protein
VRENLPEMEQPIRKTWAYTGDRFISGQEIGVIVGLSSMSRVT